jgi:predicted enzyme related to lactoylglutathione lyase
MLSVQFFVLGTTDMGRAVDFWTQALGYVVSKGGTGARWTELMPADGSGAGLALQFSETPAQEHPRIHLDLSVADAAEQAAEADRLVSLGAKRADWDLYPANPDFVVLADPDDNRFCVVDLTHIRAPGRPAGRSAAGAGDVFRHDPPERQDAALFLAGCPAHFLVARIHAV